jgi:hypothetical protein
MTFESREKRKGPRRIGVGRRIHGDRRTPDQREMTLPGWMPRQGERRAQKRRSVPDRRRTSQA